MSLSSVLKRVPDIGRQFADFVVRPRLLAKNWKLQGASRVPSKEILAWCLGASFLLFSFYKLGFGSMADNLFKAIGAPVPASIATSPPNSARPAVAHIGWQLGFGVGVDLPQASKIPTAEPQLAVFQFGASQVVLSNVVPDVLLKKPITTLLLGLYALVTVLCIQPPARLLGGAGSLAEATKLALNYYAFVGLFISAIAVVAVTLLVHLFRLEGIAMVVAWAVVVLLPFVIVSVRGFFATFSEYYGLSKKRLFLAGVGSMALSSLVGPLILVPSLYLLLWAAPLLDVVL